MATASMASNLKKAGSAIRKSFRTRRYASFDAKENNNMESPSQFRKRNESEMDEDINAKQYELSCQSMSTQGGLRRQSSVTHSMRQAVGTIKQKFRMSTRRHTRLSENKSRRHSLGGIRKRRDVKMSSPFGIETPRSTERNKIKTCLTMMETPTRLRREVEDLTSNMQALNTLTPNTLHSKRVRRSPPITNGSLKTPRSTRKRVTTDIY